jgi:methylmalonyl-CoA mutase
MLQEEFHLTCPIDPAGGSWYVESLTDALAEKIWEIIQDVQSRGGMLECVKDGYVQSCVNGTLQERFKRLAMRSDRAVGVNMYANAAETSLVDDPLGVERRSVRAHEIIPILAHRWTEQFEELRHRTERYKARAGDNAKIFLANMGPVSQHKARADFITGFMEVGGFEILKNDGYETTDECADAAAKSGADIAVVCSTDATYPEIVPPLTRAIKAKKPAMKVYVAGSPAEEFKQSYLDAGVDAFVHIRSNCLAVLDEIQKIKGMN